MFLRPKDNLVPVAGKKNKLAEISGRQMREISTSPNENRRIQKEVKTVLSSLRYEFSRECIESSQYAATPAFIIINCYC